MTRAPGGRREGLAITSADAAVLDDLYRRHSLWLANALRKTLRLSTHEIEDLVQEAYLRLSIYSQSELAEQPKALLLRIGLNLARDRGRSSAVRAKATDAMRASGILGLSGICAAEQEELLDLKRLVLSLPLPLREVFVLSRFTSMTYEQIAAHLGISVKTVEWRMGKALASCAARLRD